MNLQLGFSLQILGVFLERTYCAPFLVPRKESLLLFYGDEFLYPYHSKVLGDNSNRDYEEIAPLERNICDFLSRKGDLLTTHGKATSTDIASVTMAPLPFSDVAAEPQTPAVE